MVIPGPVPVVVLPFSSRPLVIGVAVAALLAYLFAACWRCCRLSKGPQASHDRPYAKLEEDTDVEEPSRSRQMMNNNARDLEKAQALAAAQGAKEAKAKAEAKAATEAKKKALKAKEAAAKQAAKAEARAAKEEAEYKAAAASLAATSEAYPLHPSLAAERTATTSTAIETKRTPEVKAVAAPAATTSPALSRRVAAAEAANTAAAEEEEEEEARMAAEAQAASLPRPASLPPPRASPSPPRVSLQQASRAGSSGRSSRRTSPTTSACIPSPPQATVSKPRLDAIANRLTYGTKPAAPPETTRTCMTTRKLALREKDALESKLVGTIGAGTELRVVAQAQLKDGTQRACVAPLSGSSSAPAWPAPLGWVTIAKEGQDLVGELSAQPAQPVTSPRPVWFTGGRASPRCRPSFTDGEEGSRPRSRSTSPSPSPRVDVLRDRVRAGLPPLKDT